MLKTKKCSGSGRFTSQALKGLAPAKVALVCGLLHFGFSLLIQVENYLCCVWGNADGATLFGLFRFFLMLALTQHQHLFVAALVGLGYLAVGKKHSLRLLYVCSTFVLHVLMVIDQVGYKVLFGHMGPQQMEAGTGQAANLKVMEELSGSFFAELDFFSFVNVVVVVMLTYCYFILCSSARVAFILPGKESAPTHRSCWMVGGLIYLFVSLAMVRSNVSYSRFNLPQHPLSAWLNLFGGANAAAELVSLNIDLNYKFRLPVSNVDPRLSKDNEAKFGLALRTLRTQIATAPRKPNILLVVVESGGPGFNHIDGAFDPSMMPHAAKRQANSITFGNMFTMFPGTSRGLVPMFTGGQAVTWGSVRESFNARYTGPTLINELKKEGYTTVFRTAETSKALEIDQLKDFLWKQAWDDKASCDFAKHRQLTKTGCYEESVSTELARNLIEKKEPWFGMYLSMASHHPYEVPAKWKTKDDDRRGRYEDSMRYTDDAIQQMLDVLDKEGKLENTIVLITADHGQAFGHYNRFFNIAHKNYLYNENIQTFLQIYAKGKIHGNHLSQRAVTNGAIFPTIWGIIKNSGGRSQRALPAPDLLSSSYENMIVYSYKTTAPIRYALFDGRWKYINLLSGKEPELYDLYEDPTEQKNLAESQRGRADNYENMGFQWFVAADCHYQSNLEDFYTPLCDRTARLGSEHGVSLDFRTQGPKQIKIARKISMAEIIHFTDDKVVLGLEGMYIAWVRWLAYDKNTDLVMIWTLPSGEQITNKFTATKGVHTSYYGIPFPKDLSKARGKWRVEIKELEVDIKELKVNSPKIHVSRAFEVLALLPSGEV